MYSRITKVGAVIVLVASARAITVGTARAAGRAPAVQFTGSQLAADLVPAGNFPSGYRYAKSASYNSGNQLETGQATYHLASVSCTTFGNHYAYSGFGETAVATNLYRTQAYDYTAFGQTVYQFANASAARSFWLGSRSVTVRCPGFGSAAVAGYTHGTEQILGVYIRGTHAFQADFSGSLSQVGSVRLQTLVVLRGQDVIEIDVQAFGRAVPGSPSLRTLMTRLLARVP